MNRPTHYWVPTSLLHDFTMAMKEVGDDELMQWLKDPENLEKVRATFLEKSLKEAVNE